MFRLQIRAMRKMELNETSSRNLHIANGILTLMYLAVRTVKPASQRGRLVMYGLLAAALILALIHILLQCRRYTKETALFAISDAAPVEQPLSLIGLIGFLGDFLALVGRHTLLLILVNRFDDSFKVLYKDYWNLYKVLHRLTVDIALAELLAGAAARLIPHQRKSRMVSPLRGGDNDRQFVLAYKRYTNILFYICFTLAFLWSFINTTMFSKIIEKEIHESQLYRQLLLICLLLAVWALICQEKRLVMLLQIAILTVGFLNYRDGGREYRIFALCVLIVAAAGRNWRTILKLSVIAGFAGFAISFFGFRSGIIEEYVAHTTDAEGVVHVRHAFGIISPTDCAAHMLFIIAAWCMFRVNEPDAIKRRSVPKTVIRYLAFLPMLLLWWIGWHYCYARIASVCIVLVIAISFIHQLGQDLFSGKMPQQKKISPIGQVLFSILACSNLAFFGWSCYMLRCPGVSSVWIPFRTLLSRALDISSIEHRIQVSQKTFAAQPITLLGTHIRERGFGGGAGTTLENYTFLDISYVKLLFNGGILFTVILIGILTYLSFRCIWENRVFFLLLLAVLSIDFLFEHHIYEYYYNVFPLLVFAVWKSGTLRTHQDRGVSVRLRRTPLHTPHGSDRIHQFSRRSHDPRHSFPR